MGPSVRTRKPGVNLRFFRPSNRVVVRARICVASVAKMRCHVGRITAWFVRLFSRVCRGAYGILDIISWRGYVSILSWWYSLNWAVSMIHLLKRMVMLDQNIHDLYRQVSILVS